MTRWRETIKNYYDLTLEVNFFFDFIMPENRQQYQDKKKSWNKFSQKLNEEYLASGISPNIVIPRIFSWKTKICWIFLHILQLIT